MQDDFDSGMGMPDDDLTGGSPTPEMGGREVTVTRPSED